mmetsp:Transcript_48066/g.159315  ORF Transcript_48066/g.159315 Transcript_48066/m.159315 type:complete len:409 (-) Transcript_48066:6738-7964(-)
MIFALYMQTVRTHTKVLVRVPPSQLWREGRGSTSGLVGRAPLHDGAGQLAQLRRAGPKGHAGAHLGHERLAVQPLVRGGDAGEVAAAPRRDDCDDSAVVRHQARHRLRALEPGRERAPRRRAERLEVDARRLADAVERGVQLARVVVLCALEQQQQGVPQRAVRHAALDVLREGRAVAARVRLVDPAEVRAVAAPQDPRRLGGDRRALGAAEKGLVQRAAVRLDRLGRRDCGGRLGGARKQLSQQRGDRRDRVGARALGGPLDGVGQALAKELAVRRLELDQRVGQRGADRLGEREHLAALERLARGQRVELRLRPQQLRLQPGRKALEGRRRRREVVRQLAPVALEVRDAQLLQLRVAARAEDVEQSARASHPKAPGPALERLREPVDVARRTALHLGAARLLIVPA